MTMALDQAEQRLPGKDVPVPVGRVLPTDRSDAPENRIAVWLAQMIVEGEHARGEHRLVPV